MSRTLKEGSAAVRDIVDEVSGNLLRATENELLSSVDYDDKDFIHNGLIHFGDVFLSESDNAIEIVEIIAEESGTVLFKPDLKLYLFDPDCDIDSTAGDIFDYTGVTSPVDVRSIQTIAATDYTDMNNGINVNFSRAVKTVTKDKYIKQHTGDNSRDLKGVLQFNSSTPNRFDDDSTFRIKIRFIHK